MAGSGSNPFSVFDQLTAARAAMESEQEIKVEAGVDIMRLKREAQRRERLGQLRAREHESKRPKRARPAFGYTNPY
jgi:hypothetical protein